MAGVMHMQDHLTWVDNAFRAFGLLSSTTAVGPVWVTSMVLPGAEFDPVAAAEYHAACAACQCKLPRHRFRLDATTRILAPM